MNALTAINPDIPKDPASLGWPPTLPIEVAMRETSPADLMAEYGYSQEEWHALKTNPEFLSDLAAAVEMLKKDGMKFKVKAQLQAEELLKTSWRLIHDKETASSVRADLIKSTMRWAGYDNKEAAGGAVNAAALNIQINL